MAPCREIALSAEERLQAVSNILQGLAAYEIAPLFNGRCKVTIIVRDPELPDGGTICTNDNLAGITGQLQRMKWSP